MKILHVCESIIGGTGTYLNELIPNLKKHYGNKNVIILVPKEHLDYLSDESKASVVCFNRPNRKIGLIYLLITYIKTIIKYRPDIVHAHSTFAGLIVRLLFPAFFRIPIIYCPHGWATEMKQSSLQKSLIIKIEYMLSWLCKKIHAISESEKKTALEIGINTKKIVKIYNGINPEPPNLNSIIWDDKRLKILFIGRFDQQKGLDVLLDATQSLHETVCLKLIGGAVNDKVDIDFNKYKNIECIGWKKATEIASYTNACDLVVIPSRWEGFGLVAIEAMRMAKPVLASNTGGLSEIVIDGKTGFLVPPENVECLHNCISSIKKETLGTMGKEGRKRFQSLFTTSAMVENIIKLYDEL